MIFHLDTVRYFWEVYENNEYSALFDNLKVLDLGCSSGEFTLWIYPRAERIWAVDSEQELVDNLNKTIKDNGLEKITTIVDRVIDLADFMSGHAIDKVDILKIDIEGGEYEIFERDNFPVDKVMTIIGEYHKYSPGDLLSKKGYRYIELPNKHFIARL